MQKPNVPRQPTPPRSPRGRKPGAAPYRPVSKPGGGGINAGAVTAVAAVVVGGIMWLNQPSAPSPTATAAASSPGPALVIPPKPGAEAAKPAVVPAPASAVETPSPEVAATTEPKEVAEAPSKTASTPAAIVPDVVERRVKAADLDSAALLILTGSAATQAPAVKARADALQAALDGGQWKSFSSLLERSLAPVLKTLGTPSGPQGYDGVLDEPAAREAVIQHALIKALPEKALKAITKASAAREFHQWLFTQPEGGEAYLGAVTPEDNAAEVIDTWSDLWLEDKDARGKFSALALACSLVFEKPLKFDWNKQSQTVSAIQRYSWYKLKAGAGALAAPIHHMAARDLVWTVCARVPDSELEWALKKLNNKQKNWGSTYDQVPYDMEKAVKGTSKYDSYTFEEILKKGGVCSDRAYFSANTARAAGIPAAEVGGDGSRGPHAWVTWMSDEGQWSSAGRYGGYPLGNVSDPQTGKGRNEQEFTRRSDKRTQSPEALLKGLRLVWIGDVFDALGQTPQAGLAFAHACKANPQLPKAWTARLAFMDARLPDAPVAEWQAVVDSLKREFKDDIDLLAVAKKAEETRIFPRQDMKLVLKELKKDERRLEKADEKTSVDQATQIAKTVERQAKVLAEAKDLDGARQLYDKAYREHGKNPAVFRVLAKDCWKIVKGTPDVAKKACHDMESSFRRYVDAGGDYFDITSQMSALSVVEACYKEIGETEKAASLRKDVEKSNAKAAKRAI